MGETRRQRAALRPNWRQWIRRRNRCRSTSSRTHAGRRWRTRHHSIPSSSCAPSPRHGSPCPLRWSASLPDAGDERRTPGPVLPLPGPIRSSTVTSCSPRTTRRRRATRRSSTAWGSAASDVQAASGRRAFSAAAASYDSAAALARAKWVLAWQPASTSSDWLRIVLPTSAAPRAMASANSSAATAAAAALDCRLRSITHSMLAAVRLARRTLGAPDRARASARQWRRAAATLADGTLDLAWSSLMLHWLDDPLPAFRELNRALAHGRTADVLGPPVRTVKELRAAAADAGASDTSRRFSTCTTGRHASSLQVSPIPDGHGNHHAQLRDRHAASSPTSATSASAMPCWGASRGGIGAACLTRGPATVRDASVATFEIVYGHAVEAGARTGRRSRHCALPPPIERTKRRPLRLRNPLAHDPLLAKESARAAPTSAPTARA